MAKKHPYREGERYTKKLRFLLTLDENANERRVVFKDDETGMELIWRTSPDTKALQGVIKGIATYRFTVSKTYPNPNITRAWISRVQLVEGGLRRRAK